MNITTIGIDLAKEIITVYAQDAAGRCVMLRYFKFKELLGHSDVSTTMIYTHVLN